MEKLIITAAICGAEVTKAQNEAVPYTVEEMVREAKSAYEAGAAILHIHVREDDGTPTQGRERFKVVMDAIRKELPDVIMIPSTGGATGMSPEERLQPTELFPEMATLDCGTCNFGDEIFDNTMPTMRAFGKRMIENGIKPEYECFELGHIDTVLGMAKKGEVPGDPMQFNFVLGVHGCTPRHCGEPGVLRQQDPGQRYLDRVRRGPRCLDHGRCRYRYGRQRPRGLRGQHLSGQGPEGRVQRRAGGQGRPYRQGAGPRDRYPR